MKKTILIVSLLLIAAFPLYAVMRESHSAQSSPVTLNALLPDVAGCVFPSDGQTGLPGQVTLVWSYDADPLREATGFRVYKDTVLQGTVPGNGAGSYSYQISGLAWGSTTQWQIVPTNAAGDCPTLYTWDFSVMAEPADPAGAPSTVVYMVHQDYSGSDPDPIVLPEIDLGDGPVTPQADFQYASPVSNFDIGVRFSDQPFQPVPNPQYTGAAFSADFPAGVQTNATFSYGGPSVGDQLMRWNGSSWEDVPGATFGAGWVNFTHTSATRSEEHFVVNDGDGTLPVTMSSFNATVTDADFVQLNWITQSETNLLGYNVFRNRDENVESAIRMNATIISATNTATEQQYSFTDDQTDPDGEYYYWLNSIELDGQTVYYGPVHVTLDDEETPPAEVTPGIHAIYPNPFNPSTTISYGLDHESDVMVTIYNVQGQIVRTFALGSQPAGEIHRIEWNGRNDQGHPVSSGVYLIRLQTDDMKQIRKAMLLK